MTVFKTFLKVLYACKIPIITYTIILVIFGGINIKTSDENINFVANKPDVAIINNDVDEGITKNLIEYMAANTNIVDIKDKKSIDDALFYRDINYVIYIPLDFNKEFLKGNNPKIEIKTTGDYQSSLAELILNKYIKTANVYVNLVDKDEIIDSINDTLNINTEVILTSKLDSDNLSKLTSYYNFSSYSILAGCVYVICLILSSFKNEKIKKRTIVSSMNYKDYNKKLLISNTLFAFILWILYVLLSVIFVGKVVFTLHGLFYIINSFIFTICAVSIAFLIGNTLNNKNAINGIVNVVALGSSFLCGAFVPIEWLPDSVLKIAHILPTYWFIKTNEYLKVLENINFDTIMPILINMSIIIVFTIFFIILTNVISNRKSVE